MRGILQYLDRYAEKQSGSLDVRGTWDEVAVLPYLDEGELFPLFFESFNRAAEAASRRVLLIVVVNSREDHGPAVRVRHEEFLKTALPNVLMLDRNYQFQEKEGVGLARKIGADFALRLWQRKQIRSDLFHSVDADTVLPLDYFLKRASHRIAGVDDKRVSAYTYRFFHDYQTNEALRLYDLFIRYYWAGLTFAGSPYSFLALGSTLAIPFHSYCEVRGFPRRQAGEDFYLLSKLAKIGRIDEYESSPVRILNRASNRTPFGTGSAISKLNPEHFTLYHPEIFAHLKSWLTSMDNFSEHRSVPTLIRELSERYFPEVEGIRQASHQALKTRPEATGLRRHLMTWFDGLKTLKAVHALRDGGFDNLPWKDAVERFRAIVSQSKSPSRVGEVEFAR